MPGSVLVVQSPMFCAHFAKINPLGPSPRVKVMGQPALTLMSKGLVGGCPQKPPVGPPCVSAQFVKGAARVTSMGAPLLLVDLSGLAMETGGPVQVVPAPGRVSAT